MSALSSTQIQHTTFIYMIIFLTRASRFYYFNDTMYEFGRLGLSGLLYGIFVPQAWNFYCQGRRGQTGNPWARVRLFLLYFMVFFGYIQAQQTRQSLRPRFYSYFMLILQAKYYIGIFCECHRRAQNKTKPFIYFTLIRQILYWLFTSFYIYSLVYVTTSK